MNTIRRVVDYFARVASESTKIKDFRIGESFQTNQDFQRYPILFLRLPFNYNYVRSKGWVTISITLSVYTNVSRDEYGNTTATNEYYFDDDINQLNDCANILNSIIQRLEDDAHKENWVFASPDNVRVDTVSNVYNDDLQGVECTLTLLVPNQCDYEGYFNNNIN